VHPTGDRPAELILFRSMQLEPNAAVRSGWLLVNGNSTAIRGAGCWRCRLEVSMTDGYRARRPLAGSVH
jgi:hypothetical protein